MSNATIVSRIYEIVAAFERGEVGATAIAESIELHEPALEAITQEIRRSLHKLSVKTIEQDLSSTEESMLNLRASRDAVNELKTVLEAISKSSPNLSFKRMPDSAT